MNSFKSKIMFGMLITCALALPLIIGASYAIYTLEDNEQKSEEKVNITTSNLDVTFEANEYISNTNGRLIKADEVHERADFSLFTVSNSKDSSNNIKYSISISEIETSYDKKTKTYPLMSRDFKWRLFEVKDVDYSKTYEFILSDYEIIDYIKFVVTYDWSYQNGETHHTKSLYL